jgi:hypothetical protein
VPTSTDNKAKAFYDGTDGQNKRALFPMLIGMNLYRTTWYYKMSFKVLPVSGERQIKPLRVTLRGKWKDNAPPTMECQPFVHPTQWTIVKFKKTIVFIP